MPTRHHVISLLLAWIAIATPCSGATSYLLVQGSFGGTPQTYKWQVNYNPGQLTTGQDLLNAIFGNNLTAAGTYSDDFGGSYPIYNTTNGSLGATYISTFDGSFLIGLKVDGVTAMQSTGYDPFWYYHATGGTDINSTIYNSALWNEAQYGPASRYLANGSFDAFNLASYGTGITESDSNTGTTLINDPVATSFSGARIVNLSAAPEPTRAMLAIVGTGFAFLRRRRSCRLP